MDKPWILMDKNQRQRVIASLDGKKVRVRVSSATYLYGIFWYYKCAKNILIDVDGQECGTSFNVNDIKRVAPLHKSDIIGIWL